MILRVVLVLTALSVSFAASAAPKIDKETCDQLKSEQATFAKSGIAADFEKGPAWAKANLTPERLREVEHYILLDEQLKFGCRQATISIDAMRAGEAANELENPKLEPATNKQDDDTKSDGSSIQNGAAESGGDDDKKPALKPVGERRPKPVERPKANDAYSPPPGAESTPKAPAPKVTNEP